MTELHASIVLRFGTDNQFWFGGALDIFRCEPGRDLFQHQSLRA